MTATYRTGGNLTHPVNDLDAARLLPARAR